MLDLFFCLVIPNFLSGNTRLESFFKPTANPSVPIKRKVCTMYPLHLSPPLYVKHSKLLLKAWQILHQNIYGQTFGLLWFSFFSSFGSVFVFLKLDHELLFPCIVFIMFPQLIFILLWCHIDDEKFFHSMISCIKLCEKTDWVCILKSEIWIYIIHAFDMGYIFYWISYQNVKTNIVGYRKLTIENTDLCGNWQAMLLSHHLFTNWIWNYSIQSPLCVPLFY